MGRVRAVSSGRTVAFREKLRKSFIRGEVFDMLMSAFRPWRQLPDHSFADVAASPIATCRWGETGAGRARSLADTLRCVVRTAPGLCLRRVWLYANNVLTFSLLRISFRRAAGFAARNFGVTTRTFASLSVPVGLRRSQGGQGGAGGASRLLRSLLETFGV